MLDGAGAAVVTVLEQERRLLDGGDAPPPAEGEGEPPPPADGQPPPAPVGAQPIQGVQLVAQQQGVPEQIQGSLPAAAASSSGAPPLPGGTPSGDAEHDYALLRYKDVHNLPDRHQSVLAFEYAWQTYPAKFPFLTPDQQREFADSVYSRLSPSEKFTIRSDKTNPAVQNALRILRTPTNPDLPQRVFGWSRAMRAALFALIAGDNTVGGISDAVGAACGRSALEDQHFATDWGGCF